jgi:endonuclease/exonuclease/phosphatase family metal-dependent hydrolase
MISVLTLNLRFGLANDGPNSWQYRKKVFPYLFEKYRPDFIGFQEANDFQTNFLNEMLTEYDFIGKRSPSPSFWQDIIVFYKKTWTCVYREHFFLSPTPNIPSRFRKSIWPRQCTMGMFKNGNNMIICVNTHLDFDPSVQTTSAKLIMDRLQRFPSDVPVIMVGDFNTTPFSPCYKIFTGHGQKTETQKCYFKNAFKKPYPGTHHGFTGNINGDYIDWILYRGKIVKQDCRVIKNRIDGLYPSDHFPVYATFKVIG